MFISHIDHWSKLERLVGDDIRYTLLINKHMGWKWYLSDTVLGLRTVLAFAYAAQKKGREFDKSRLT